MIIQNVTSLADGRASPAQLTGMIQRGDVLLCIDGVSIVNLPIDQLVEGLKPLSSPQGGEYKRTLCLRLAVGEGVALLEKSEAQAARGDSDGATDMFSLSQFIHQTVPSSAATTVSNSSTLSTTPSSAQITSVVVTKSSDALPTQITTTVKTKAAADVVPSQEQLAESLDRIISVGVADERKREYEKFTSEFFAWNDRNSELLRPLMVFTVDPAAEESLLSEMKDMVEKGAIAMKGARVLSYNVEDIDKGKDLRSFQAWNTNISLRSRASTRRRFFFDANSLGGSSKVTAHSIASAVSEEADLDGVTGEELLVRLAAYDEIWRKQVMEAIKNKTAEMEKQEQIQNGHPKPARPPSRNGEPELTDTLGSLFLGDKLHQKIKQKKKSYALPPTEVTSVLFDLISHLASTTPDEISLKGGFGLNVEISLVPFQRLRRSGDTDDMILAKQFVLEDVYPVWFKSFRPLKWGQRRLLWTDLNDTREAFGGGTFATSEDNLSMDSGESGILTNSTRKKRKNLQEMIEEMELDVEAKVET